MGKRANRAIASERKGFMRNKLLYLIILLTILTIAAFQSLPAPAADSTTANVLTGYYNLMGYEGVATIGENLANHGTVPSVGDYVTTHCRYIDVTPIYLREYYLRYILHLPEGATLTQVDAHIADFAELGSLGVELVSRSWNSRDVGTVLGSVGTDPGVLGDITLTIPDLAVTIDNQTNQYWLNVYFNQQEVPGQLCVYGIQATYRYEGAFLPLIRNGG
jgi:hypothetical protein